MKYLELIVSVRIAQVTRPDLGRHVPAVERDGRELQTAAVECQAGHGRQGVPAQAEFLEPFVPAHTNIP